MKISEFKKLEKNINEQNFNKSYKTINMVMTALSYFGHVASIFLAYFMLSKILAGAMTDNKIAVFIATTIILGGLELLKRDIFDKFSIQYLKLRTLGKDVMPLFLLSVAIIGLSFYASINGAAEYSSKADKIEAGAADSLKSFKMQADSAFALRLGEKDLEISSQKKVLDEISALALTQAKLSKDQRKLQSTLPAKIDTLKAERKRIELEKEATIKQKEAELMSGTKADKKKNDKNSFAFVIISTLIEIVILAGVYFNEYYKFRSYKEFRNKIEKDPNYQKWLLYSDMLEAIFPEDAKMNHRLPSNKGIIEACKLNDIIVMPRDVTDFIKSMISIGIFKTSGSAKYISKQRDLAFEILKKHFNIE